MAKTRFEELEEKLEREGLTAAEKAEIEVLKSKELREFRESLKRLDEVYALMLENIEKLKKI